MRQRTKGWLRQYTAKKRRSEKESFYHKHFTGEYDRNQGIAVGLLILIALGSPGVAVFIAQPSNTLFHDYTSNPDYGNYLSNQTFVSALADSCNRLHVISTCATVANQYIHDPTYPINKWTAPGNSLSEFNTAGKVSFTTSCSAWGTTKCINMTATVPPPPLPVQFKLTTTLKTLGATLIPTSFTTVYKRVTAISTNNTFQFDMTGSHSQTGTYTITTTQTTVLTFYDSVQATVTCASCTSIVYTGYSEVLRLPSGLVASPITVFWSTGTNINCLCAIVETVSPIGDLNIAASKEVEFSDYWATSKAATNCVGLTQTQITACSWGWFLTTNQTLWQTNIPTFNPYTDPTIALLMIHVNIAGAYDTNLYVQQKIGETMQAEDSGCTAGGSSCYLTQGHAVTAPEGVIDYMDLNYTGGSASAQVGGTINCPAFSGTGGPGCTYIIQNCLKGANPCSGTSAQTPIIPKLPLGGQYYLGFYVGSSQLASPVYFCYDSGADCSAQQTFVVNGCVSASMELDACVPNPITPSTLNAVASTTDSGGFFGSIARGLGSIGHFIVQGATGIYNTVVAPIANGLGGLEGALASAIGTAFQLITFALVVTLNAIGNFFGLGPIGTNIANFFTAIASWFTTVFGGILSTFGQAATFIASAIGLLISFFTSNPILLTITGFFGQLPALYTLLLTVWNDFVNGALTGLFSAQVILVGDWVYGIFETLFKGMKGFKEWLNTNELFAITMFKAARVITLDSIWFLKAIKQMLTGWL